MSNTNNQRLKPKAKSTGKLMIDGERINDSGASPTNAIPLI
jgi:hypothetical protein